MKAAADHNETEEILREAMELLADTNRNLAMFQRQQYHKLKIRFDAHITLSNEMKKALNGIDTVQDNGGEVC